MVTDLGTRRRRRRSTTQTARSRGRGRLFKTQDGVRTRGNPHDVGYCVLPAQDAWPAHEELRRAVTATGRPSLLRTVWRGMYRVRGMLSAGRLRSHDLRKTLWRYTSEKENLSRYVNERLAALHGKNISYAPLRAPVEKLVMAVRLLHSGAEPTKVYRGVSRDEVDLSLYHNGNQVDWPTFTSTSANRQVARSFAGEGGTVFTILRDPSHANAADVSSLSAFPAEQEVLLLPGTRLLVAGSPQQRDGFTEVVLQEQVTFPGEL